MLRIRLSRFGRKSRPTYRIVVANSKRQRDSSFLSNVGMYDPNNDILKINVEEYNKYIFTGAQPSDTVKQLFSRYQKQQKTI